MMTGKRLELIPLMNQASFGLIGMSVYNTEDHNSKAFDYLSQHVKSQRGCGLPSASWNLGGFCLQKPSRKGTYLTPDLENWQVESSNKLLDSGSETA